MTKLAPEWVRTSDPVIRSPARYRWTTAPASYGVEISESISSDIMPCREENMDCGWGKVLWALGKVQSVVLRQVTFIITMIIIMINFKYTTAIPANIPWKLVQQDKRCHTHTSYIQLFLSTGAHIYARMNKISPIWIIMDDHQRKYKIYFSQNAEK